MSRPVRNSILGRRRREGQAEVTLAEPSIPAAFNAPEPAAKATDAGKTARQPIAYPDRPMPQAGPQRDRWLRELVGSIIDRTAPVLLDRRDVELALERSPATFERRMRDGKLGIQDCVMQFGRGGPRELFRREEVRAELLREVGASPVAPMGRSAR